MKRLKEISQRPTLAKSAEDLMEGWGPDKSYQPEPLIKDDKINKEAMYKACIAKATSDGEKDPEGYCKIQMKKMEKAELGAKDISEQSRETFRGEPRKEGLNVLETVSRKAKEKLQEKMGQKKEVAVYQKSEYTPDEAKGKRENVLEFLREVTETNMPKGGQSYGGIKDKEKDDMTVEEKKNIQLTHNWSAESVKPLVEPEKRDEIGRYLDKK